MSSWCSSRAATTSKRAGLAIFSSSSLHCSHCRKFLPKQWCSWCRFSSNSLHCSDCRKFVHLQWCSWCRILLAVLIHEFLPTPCAPPAATFFGLHPGAMEIALRSHAFGNAIGMNVRTMRESLRPRRWSASTRKKVSVRTVPRTAPNQTIPKEIRIPNMRAALWAQRDGRRAQLVTGSA